MEKIHLNPIFEREVGGGNEGAKLSQKWFPAETRQNMFVLCTSKNGSIVLLHSTKKWFSNNLLKNRESTN